MIRNECSVSSGLKKLFLAVIYLFMLLLVSPYFIGVEAKVKLLIVALALYLYSERAESGIEVKLLFALGAWSVFTHMVGTDIFVRENTDMIICYCAMFIIVAAGAMMEPEKRLRFLDLAAIPYCLYYTIVGIVCMYSGVFQTEVFNPITKGSISKFSPQTTRMEILGENPNTMAYFFFFSLMLLLYLFFRYKKPAVRAVIIPAVLVNYLTAMFTFSRNVKLALSVCGALVILMLALKYRSPAKMLNKVLLIALVVGVSLVSVYKSFDFSAQLMSGISQAVLGKVQVSAEEQNALPDLENTTGTYEDSRSLFQDTGRIPIYKAAIQTLAEKPSRLLIGNVYAMQATNQQRYENDEEAGKTQLPDYKFTVMTHHHNVLLQTLVYLGIPGLGLMLAFLVLLVVKIIRLFFDERVSPAVKILAISLSGGCVYNMFETSLYYKVDYCSFVFLLIAGIVIACHDELKQKTTP